MHFDELVNKEVSFYGVDNNTFKVKWKESEFIFEAIEDEEDGYRSCLGGIEIVNPIEKSELIFFDKPLAKVTIKEISETTKKETWQLVDKDGHVWLEFGTNNTDDYYPWFMFEYQPKE